MSADRTVAVGEYGRSKIRCDASRGVSRCTAETVGGFRKGIKDARAVAEKSGWRVGVRFHWATNGSVLQDYCPEHQRNIP